MANLQISRQVSVSRQTEISCRQRFAEVGMDSVINDAPRSGRPRTISEDKRAEIVEATLTKTPAAATQAPSRRRLVTGTPTLPPALHPNQVHRG
jgi:transposase